MFTIRNSTIPRLLAMIASIALFGTAHAANPNLAPHVVASVMRIEATVLVSCVDPAENVEAELRAALGAGLCGEHSSLGNPVLIQKVAGAVNIVAAAPGMQANATVRVGERPGQVVAPLFDAATQTMTY